MVLKRGKYGIHTGNTLKLGSNLKKKWQHAKDQHVIIKSYRAGTDESLNKSAILDKSQQLVSDGGLSEGNKPQRARLWAITGPYEDVYSLNKRKRWLLPEMIKNAIDDLNEDDKPLNMRLVVRKINPIWYGGGRILQNSCVAYHDSTLKDPHVFPTKTYSFTSDLKNSEKARENNAERLEIRRYGGYQRRHRLQQIGEEQENNEPGRLARWMFMAHINHANHINVENAKLPCVSYEVCHPNKLIGHKRERDLSHFVRYANREFHCGARLYKGHYAKSFQKCKGRWSKRQMDFSNNIECGIEAHVHQCLGKEEWEGDNGELLQPVLASCTLGDCITNLTYCSKHRHSDRRKRGRKKSHPKDKCLATLENTLQEKGVKYGKGQAIYISRTDYAMDEPEHGLYNINYGSDSGISEDMQNDSSVDQERNVNAEVTEPILLTVIPFVKPQPLVLFINKSSISDQNMHYKFGDLYMNGYTLPRRLSVLIPLGDPDRICYNCWLVLEECANNDSDSEAEEYVICMVQVESHWLEDTTLAELYNKLQNSERNDCWTIEDLVDDVTKDLQRHAKCFIELQPDMQVHSQSKSKVVSRFSLYEDLLGWTLTSFKPEEAYQVLQDEPLNITGQKLLKRWPSMRAAGESVCLTDDHFCDICYETILREEGRGCNGTALKGCYHWFCNECWRSHLAQRISQGDVFLKCPGFKCDALVDHVTLLFLLPNREYRKYINHIQDVKLEMSPLWQWCPNSRCGCAIKINSDDNLYKGIEEGRCLQCQCGETWCSLCRREAHWPSDCQQYKSFVKLVQTKGDEAFGPTNVIYYVEVKKCPTCKHPINKNGGCQHMHCVKCRTDFCWECLGLWSDHSQLICPRGRVSTTTVEIDQDLYTSQHEQFYKLAVKHRRARRTWKLHKETNRILSSIYSFKKKNGSIRRSEDLIPEVPVAWPLDSDLTMFGTHMCSRLHLADGMEEEAKFLISVNVFTYQLHFLLEQGFVVLSTCKAKHMKTLKGRMDSLELLLARTKVLLLGSKTKGWMFGELKANVKQGKQKSLQVIKAIRITQKLMQKRTEPLT